MLNFIKLFILAPIAGISWGLIIVTFLLALLTGCGGGGDSQVDDEKTMGADPVACQDCKK